MPLSPPSSWKISFSARSIAFCHTGSGDGRVASALLTASFLISAVVFASGLSGGS